MRSKPRAARPGSPVSVTRSSNVQLSNIIPSTPLKLSTITALNFRASRSHMATSSAVVASVGMLGALARGDVKATCSGSGDGEGGTYCSGFLVALITGAGQNEQTTKHNRTREAGCECNPTQEM